MTSSDSVEARQAALAEISGDAKLTAVLDYWRTKAGDGAVAAPERDRSGGPAARRSPPFLTILDVLDGGENFRIRLVGTASAQAAGKDFTGKTVDQAMSGDVLTATLARYRAVIAHRRPVLGYSEYALADGSTIKNLLMTLPLSSDGIVVDRLLGVFSPKSNWHAEQSLRHLDAGAYRKPQRSHIVL